MSFSITDLVKTLNQTLHDVMATERSPKVVQAAERLLHRLAVVTTMITMDMREANATQRPMDVEALRDLGVIRGQVMILTATRS